MFRIALESGWRLVRALVCKLNFQATTVVPVDASRHTARERRLAFQPHFFTLTASCAAVLGVRVPRCVGASHSRSFLDRLTHARAVAPCGLALAPLGLWRKVCRVP